MKIMIVTPYFYPKVGGLESYALAVAKGLKEHYEHDIVVVTSNHEIKKRDEIIVEGIRVIRLPILFKISNTPINPLWYFNLRRIIKTEKPNVINTHSPVPFMADMATLAARTIPVVTTYHSGSMLKGTGGMVDIILGLYEKYLLPNILNRAVNIAAVYPKFVEKMVKDTNKVSFIPPGVDTSIFKPSPSTKKHIDVIFVGRLEITSSWKGVDVLLDALNIVKKSYPKVSAQIIGNGDAIDEYKKLALQLGILNNVEFIENLKGSELVPYYRNAKMLVLPSKTESEAFGMVLAEALSCGTPVIGSRIGGIPNVINDGKNGLLVNPSDTDDLAKKINMLMGDDELYNKLSINCRDSIRDRYSIEKLLKNMDKIVNQVARPRVLIIHNIVSPYRLPIFEELHNNLNLEVLFCKRITSDRKWSTDLSNYSFPYTILNGFSFGPILFNTNFIRALHSSTYDVIVISSDPDVAPTTIYSLILSKIRRKKIILWSENTNNEVHSFPSISYSDKYIHKKIVVALSGLVLLYRKVYFKLSDHFIAFSKRNVDYLVEHGVQLSQITKTMQVMPLNQLPSPTIVGKRNGKTFLYIGYINPLKNIELLINAFKGISNQNARLIIAGTGSAEDKIKKLAKVDSRIIFKGFVDNQSKANLCIQSDILVLPSLNDCWGLVINEAIHYGMAVICSDKAGASEIINDQSGRIISPQDTSELSEVMSTLINNQNILRKMQKHNRGDSTVTDIYKVTNDFLSAINKVMI